MSTATTIHAPVPESVLLYKRVIAARVVARRADAEAAEARAHLAALEAEYRAAKLECAA